MTRRKHNLAKQLPAKWQHFDVKRSNAAHGDLGLLLENTVGVSMPTPSSHFDLLHEMARAAHEPIPVKSLSERLRASVAPRGYARFGDIGDQIEAIICNYPTLRWWLEADGLVVDEPRDKLDELSQFDRVVGALVLKHWTGGRLPKQALIEITREIDREGFQLRDHLQPKQWKSIADYHIKIRNKAIETFSDAAKDLRFTRSVRRRLYVARDRYQKALQDIQLPYDL